MIAAAACVVCGSCKQAIKGGRMDRGKQGVSPTAQLNQCRQHSGAPHSRAGPPCWARRSAHWQRWVVKSPRLRALRLLRRQLLPG